MLAEPGEFTKRAFLNGRIDLVQAEAVIDIIRSRSSGGLDAALHQLEGKLSQPIMQIRDDLVQMLAHIEAGIDFVDEDITFVTSAECVGGIKVSIAALQALIDNTQNNVNGWVKIKLYISRLMSIYATLFQPSQNLLDYL